MHPSYGPAPPPLAHNYGSPPPHGPPPHAQQGYYQPGPSPYYPPPAQYSPPQQQPFHPPETRHPTSYKQVAKSFLTNQNVEVQINANVWVMGIVVAVLNVAHKMFGCAYQVEYTSPDTHRITQSSFWPTSVREYRR